MLYLPNRQISLHITHLWRNWWSRILTGHKYLKYLLYVAEKTYPSNHCMCSSSSPQTLFYKTHHDRSDLPSPNIMFCCLEFERNVNTLVVSSVTRKTARERLCDVTAIALSSIHGKALQYNGSTRLVQNVAMLLASLFSQPSGNMLQSIYLGNLNQEFFNKLENLNGVCSS